MKSTRATSRPPSTIPSRIPSTPPISAVITLSCRIIRRTWRRVIPIARSMPDLARALEHRQDERVDDPEEADDHRQREQDVEEVQDDVEPADLVIDELPPRLRPSRSGTVFSARVERRPGSPRLAAAHAHERVEVLRLRVDACPRPARDRDVPERRAAGRGIEDAVQHERLARRSGTQLDRRADVSACDFA